MAVRLWWRGEIGGWTPIGAVKTASGYDVAWKMAGANEYTVWTTDSSGNYCSSLHRRSRLGRVRRWNRSRPIFHQDMNVDGTISATIR